MWESIKYIYIYIYKFYYFYVGQNNFKILYKIIGNILFGYHDHVS